MTAPKPKVCGFPPGFFGPISPSLAVPTAPILSLSLHHPPQPPLPPNLTAHPPPLPLRKHPCTPLEKTPVCLFYRLAITSKLLRRCCVEHWSWNGSKDGDNDDRGKSKRGNKKPHRVGGACGDKEGSPNPSGLGVVTGF